MSDTRTETVWIIGGGTVAQSYAHWLLRAGVHVALIVRDGRARRLASGFCLRDMNRSGHPTHHWPPGPSLSVHADAPRDGEAPSAAILALDSIGLRSDWTAERLRQLDGTFPVVVLPPGMADPAYVGGFIDPARLVPGLISLVAWTAPLEGEAPRSPEYADVETTALWLPPFSALPFGGTREAAEPVVALLQRGGARAKWAPDVMRKAPMAGAVMSTAIAALESAGWTLDGLRAEPARTLGAQAAQEALAGVSAELGLPVPFALRSLARPAALGVIAWAGPSAVPFPLEVYLRVHFTKVGEQMRAQLDSHIARNEQHGLGSDALRTLRASLAEIDAAGRGA